MRSLAHEFATQRNATPTRHDTWGSPPRASQAWDAPGPWDGPRHAPVPPAAPVLIATAGPTRRAVLRRALRQGLLRPAARLRDMRDASSSR